MSLWKAIAHGKEHRKPYRGAPAFDRSCRPHGGCPYCERGRQYSTRKWKKVAEDTREEYLNYWEDFLIESELYEEQEEIRQQEWLIYLHNLLYDYEY